jgi:UDP-2,4-diacetamido-2,4,6-trideoxy-beta-L-altropyranose hydrolase
LIAVVADGGPAAGLGHLARCSAITVALRARGADVACVAYGTTESRTVDGVVWTPADVPPARAVLLDSYTMPAAERAALGVLAVIHDEGELPAEARLVISMTEVDAPDALVLAGLAYAPLRPQYWGVPARTVRPHVRRILVTTGGGALQSAGVATAATLRDANPEASVAIVRGPYADFAAPDGVELVDAPPSLLRELLAADVVVTAAGQSALEAVATGAATVAVPLASNQRANADALALAGAAVIAEPGDEVAAVEALDRTALAERGQRAVDGFGALRIAYRVAELG